MAQDIVGRCQVKKELRHAEGQQQGLTGKFSRRAIPKCEDDFLLAGAVDLRGLYAPHEIPRDRDACLEFGNVRLSLRKYRGIDAGQQSAGKHRVPVGFAHLAREIAHVGIEARVEQNSGIDFSHPGMGRRMVKQIGQAAEEMGKDLTTRPSSGLLLLRLG